MLIRRRFIQLYPLHPLRSPLVLLAVPFVELFQYAYFAVCFDQQFPASLRFRREQDRLLGKLLVARFQ